MRSTYVCEVLIRSMVVISWSLALMLVRKGQVVVVNNCLGGGNKWRNSLPSKFTIANSLPYIYIFSRTFKHLRSYWPNTLTLRLIQGLDRCNYESSFKWIHCANPLFSNPSFNASPFQPFDFKVFS